MIEVIWDLFRQEKKNDFCKNKILIEKKNDVKKTRKKKYLIEALKYDEERKQEEKLKQKSM